jgi:colanic acid biosynthesis glycosyl transferase WcaI
MRILIIGLNFWPEITSTGKYTSELAVHLASHGHAVHVVTAPPYYPHWKVYPGYSSWQYRRDHYQGMQVYRCPLWVPRRPSGLSRLLHLFSFAFFSFPVALLQAFWKPRIVLCIAPTFFSAPVALLVGKLSQAKTWLHIQDFELEAAFNLNILPGSRFLRPLANFFERVTLKQFDHVSTISNNMLRLGSEKGIPVQRAGLLFNWVNTRAIRPLDGENPLRHESGISEKQLIVLYHGNMGRKQGLEMLIEAAVHLQDVPHLLFLLCGEGPIRPQLEKQAARLPNVRFLDLQPQEKLNQLVNLADIHILPQHAGVADLVMPSKLTTMLASGKAVIATAHENTELGRIARQVGLLVPPEDVAALAQAIRNLVNDPEQRSRLGHLGREFAVKNWDQDLILGEFTRQLDHFVAQT